MITKFRLVLTFVVLLVVTYYFILHDILFSPKLPPSKLLSEIVDYLDFVKFVDEKTIEMLNDDPFGDLVNEVRPQLDEIASIKKQTGIYERMEQIPGGPQSFIKSASEAVERIQEDIYKFEQRYRLILARMNKNNRILVDQHMKRLTSDMIRVLETMGNQLQDYKLYFLPDEDKTIPNPSETVNIEFIKTRLLELSKHFAQIEALYPNDDILSILTGKNPDLIKLKTNPNQESYRRIKLYTDVSKEILETTMEHGDSTFNGVNPYVIDITDKLRTRLVQVIDHHGRCKERYEKLVDGIDLDVTSTRERIKNLGKSKPRKVEVEL